MAFYNLDMIISLGYRINSKVATRFRIWATQRLKEYIVKGFTMDDARLKELGGGGYWKELLERIWLTRSLPKIKRSTSTAFSRQAANGYWLMPAKSVTSRPSTKQNPNT